MPPSSARVSSSISPLTSILSAWKTLVAGCFPPFRPTVLSTKSASSGSVRDSGIGMTQMEQSRVFKPYTQADTSIARRYGGTGLGLAITKSVVQMHKGDIKVYSKAGEGTTFSVRIPLQYKE